MLRLQIRQLVARQLRHPRTAPPDTIALAAVSGGGRMPTAVFEEARSSLHGVLPDPVYAGLSCADGDVSRLPVPAGDKGGPCRY